MENNFKYSFLAFICVSLISCIQPPENNGLGGYLEEEDLSLSLTDSSKLGQKLTENSIVDTSELINFTDSLIDLLHDEELIRFAETFHPEKGCYFSPYTYIDSNALHFTNEAFHSSIKKGDIFTWGEFDGGSGMIEKSIEDYNKSFIYCVDFKTQTEQVHFKDNLAFSNTLNNISDFFPNTQIVEYYYPGTQKYEGMDWKSIIFVCEKHNNQYYLVACVHNEWTI